MRDSFYDNGSGMIHFKGEMLKKAAEYSFEYEKTMLKLAESIARERVNNQEPIVVELQDLEEAKNRLILVEEIKS